MKWHTKDLGEIYDQDGKLVLGLQFMLSPAAAQAVCLQHNKVVSNAPTPGLQSLGLVQPENEDGHESISGQGAQPGQAAGPAGGAAPDDANGTPAPGRGPQQEDGAEAEAGIGGDAGYAVLIPDEFRLFGPFQTPGFARMRSASEGGVAVKLVRI